MKINQAAATAMQVVPIIIVLLLGGTVVVCCARAPFSSPRHTGSKRLVLFVASGLLVIGSVGFFGSGVSAFGGLNWLPDSFEWPAGYVTGVITTGNGLFVVPHTPSGRVQVYDSDWKFIRGWHVDAGGGTFKLKPSGADQIEVFTPRGQSHYVFNDHGKLIFTGKYSPESYSAVQGEGRAVVVPTRPWLWVFAHPGISWIVLIVGGVIMIFVDRKPVAKATTSHGSNRS